MTRKVLCREQNEVPVTEWWFDRNRAVETGAVGYLECLREAGHDGPHAFPKMAGGWYRWTHVGGEELQVGE